VSVYVSAGALRRALADDQEHVHQQPLWHIAVAGAGAGAVNTIIVAPVELIKIKLQTQRSVGAEKEFRWCQELLLCSLFLCGH
jgi:Mitochondrial carrier protein